MSCYGELSFWQRKSAQVRAAFAVVLLKLLFLKWLQAIWYVGELVSRFVFCPLIWSEGWEVPGRQYLRGEARTGRFASSAPVSCLSSLWQQEAGKLESDVLKPGSLFKVYFPASALSGAWLEWGKWGGNGVCLGGPSGPAHGVQQASDVAHLVCLL